MDSTKLFAHASLGQPISQPPSTSSIRSRHEFVLRSSHGPRHAHLLRLYTLLLHLLSLPPSRETTHRTLRAWRALASCKEIELDALWAVGAKILDRWEGPAEEDNPSERRVEWLRATQDSKVDQEPKFVELVLALIAVGRPRQALDELDAFITSRPYHDSIQLHVLAGLLTLYLAQPGGHEHDSDADSVCTTATRSSSRIASLPTTSQTPRPRASRSPSVSGGPNSSDLLPHLRSLLIHAPARLSQAKELFRRAAELEAEQELSSRGEGQRWLDLLSSLDHSISRKRSRSLSP